MDKLALFGGPCSVTTPISLYRSTGHEEVAAVARVMDSGVLSGFVGAWCPEFNGGPEVQAFEREWAVAFDCRHAVSVNSNTSGMIAALGAVGIGPGDEVIVPPYTMSATAVAPLFYGGIPVFADIEEDFFCLDPESVEENITPRTKAIMAVNLFGQPADVIRLRQIADRHGIYLIEDNAQAPFASQAGRMAGTIGHIGVFSLNYHKHFHTGEGGMCTTADDHLADRLRMIRNHGENVADQLGNDDYTNLIGFNFRMTELSAAIGREQLKKAPGLIKRRVEIADRLTSGLKGLHGITPPKVRADSSHVYYIWAGRFDEKSAGVPRDAFSKALTAEGVVNSVGYVEPLYLLPAFQKRIAIGRDGFPFNLTNRTYAKGLCPVTERLHEKEVLEYFVCSYDPTDSQVDEIVAAFKKVHAQRHELKEMR